MHRPPTPLADWWCCPGKQIPLTPRLDHPIRCISPKMLNTRLCAIYLYEPGSMLRPNTSLVLSIKANNTLCKWFINSLQRSASASAAAIDLFSTVIVRCVKHKEHFATDDDDDGNEPSTKIPTLHFRATIHSIISNISQNAHIQPTTPKGEWRGRERAEEARFFVLRRKKNRIGIEVVCRRFAISMHPCVRWYTLSPRWKFSFQFCDPFTHSVTVVFVCVCVDLAQFACLCV